MRPFSTLFFWMTATLLFSIEVVFVEVIPADTPDRNYKVLNIHEQTSAPEVPPTPRALEADSIPIYQEQIYRYTDSYNHKRKAGNSLLVAGAGIIATSAYPFYEAYSCEREDDCMSNATAYVIRDCFIVAGVAVMSLGGVLKMVGLSKDRKRKLYQEKLNLYKKNHPVTKETEGKTSLRAVPFMNPVKKRSGIQLSLYF